MVVFEGKKSSNNILNKAPMTTKFVKEKKIVKDNSKVTSGCSSVGLSVHPMQKRKKARKKESKKERNQANLRPLYLDFVI